MSWAEVDDDVARMLAFQRGDELAFEQLYRAHRLAIFRFCARIVRRTDQGEELAQEVFVRVYRAREGYRPTARFKTWLYRIATHLCLHARDRAHVRSEGPDAQGLERHASTAAGPLRLVEAKELGELIQDALDAMPERQRVALVLARWHEHTMADIGAVLDISAGGVKALLHRARETLRVALADHLDVDAEEDVG